METVGSDTKGKILNSAYRQFYRQGFSRVSVDAIATQAGVTKRTVYYHFESKDEIAAAVMEVQHFYLIQQFEGWVGTDPISTGEFVTRLFSKLNDWAESPDWLGSGFTRIAAELADLQGHPARVSASQHKVAVETWLADQLAATGALNAGQLSRQIMVLIEGSMSLALIHRDTHYIKSAQSAALRLSEDPTPSGNLPRTRM